MLPSAALLSAALAAVSPTAGLEVAPTSARPGDAILLTARTGEAEPTATVAGRTVRFWHTPAGWRAIAGLPVEAPAGHLGITGEALGTPLAGALEIVDPRFPAKTLTVPPRFVQPRPEIRARMAEDQRAFDAAFSRPFAPPVFDGPFGRPLDTEVTGGYGDRRVYNGRQRSQHYGLDLDAALGTPIAAANDGVVVMVRDNYQAGLTVLLWHGADLYSAYFHLSKAEVEIGQAVKRGEPIARSGGSGRATGPHLHWGIKVAGRWVDPESVLRLGAFAR